MATERINNATDKVVEYMYREEDRHFREWINDDDYKDSVKFVKKLKEHILYSVVVLKYKGNMKEIYQWIQEYWNEYGIEEEDECVYVVKAWEYNHETKTIDYFGLLEDNEGNKEFKTEEEARTEFDYVISEGNMGYCSLSLVKIDPNSVDDRETCIDEWEDNIDDYIDEEEEYEIKTKCGCRIIRDSKEHDGCVCDDEGENWICENCYKGEYDKEEEEEEGEKEFIETFKNDDFEAMKILWENRKNKRL